MTLSYRDVAEIVKIVDSSNCEEVCLELDGAKILIRRKGAGETSAAAPATPTPAPRTREPASSRQEEGAAANRANVPTDGDDTVFAPMVGTFYARPAPEEPEFVTIGTQVEIGTPLCMIEVMKLFTTVESTKAGTVTSVLVEDGQMVEYGQPLFVIK